MISKGSVKMALGGGYTYTPTEVTINKDGELVIVDKRGERYVDPELSTAMLRMSLSGGRLGCRGQRLVLA